MNKFIIHYLNENWFLDFLALNSDFISWIIFTLDNKLSNYNKKEFEEVYKICFEKNIKIYLNFPDNCEWNLTWNKNYFLALLKLIKLLKQEFNISWVFFTNLLYVNFLKKYLPDLKYYAWLWGIIHSDKKWVMAREAGVDGFLVYEWINRNISKIKQIKNKLNLDMFINLNPWCIKFCPFDRVHNNMISHWVDLENKNNLIFKNWCNLFLEQTNKSSFLIPFILPQDLYRYDWLWVEYILYSNNLKNLELILDSYIKKEYNGELKNILQNTIFSNLLPNISIEKLVKNEFFTKIQNCLWNCQNCNICEEFIN